MLNNYGADQIYKFTIYLVINTKEKQYKKMVFRYFCVVIGNNRQCKRQ